MLASIPFYVWPLFVLLLIVGIKARKTTKVSFKRLLLLPSMLFVWSVASFFVGYGDEYKIVALWALCLAVGIFLGFWHLQKLGLRIDKENKSVVIPGSWVPLIISMVIFTSKFLIGLLSAVFPETADSALFLSLELTAGVMLGVFWGRAAGCLEKCTQMIKHENSCPKTQCAQ